MSVLSLLRGPNFGGDGTTPQPRGTRAAAMVVQQASGKYREAVFRKNCYFASVGASGAAPGTAIGTTAFITLYNPASSGVNLLLLHATLGYISGTIGAGTMYLVGGTSSSQTAPSAGTAITPTNAFIGSANASVAAPRSTATVASGGVALRELASFGAILASTTFSLSPFQVDLDGSIWITPGCRVDMQAVAAAGTVPLLTGSFLWEEVIIGQE